MTTEDIPPTRLPFWLIASLAIGSAGGALAAWIGIPLPWMLGSMGACLGAVLFGARLVRPGRLIDPMRMVLGVMLGSTLSPALLSSAVELGLGVGLLVPYILACTFVGYHYFRRLAGFVPAEALFSATPGGIYTMTAYAEDMGVDVRRVALIQASRILLVVAVLPFVLRWLSDSGATTSVMPTHSRIDDIGLVDALLLTGAGLTGWIAAKALRLPGAAIVGPMFASGFLHLAGITSSEPPAELVIAAQIVLGVSIGTLFIGTTTWAIVHSLAISAGFVAIMLVITVGTAWVANVATGVELYAGIIAYAPGGLTEMSLVALGLGYSVGYVATLHLMRILFIALLAPFILRMYGIVVQKGSTEEMPDGRRDR